jgi:CRISPR-associated protein Cmr5
MATLEQQRAQHAWTCAQHGVAQHGEKYVNDAKGLPALIMNSGLMQVMAFLREKGKKDERYETLASQLRGWLHERCQTPIGFNEFMEALLAIEPRSFQAVTGEALAWLKWLRQIAPAVPAAQQGE